MTLEVFFTPAELAAGELNGRAVVVVDVLRSASTIVEALANGARAVLPAVSTDEAVRVVQNVGRGAALLCGERKGERIAGFDLGNSPLEFSAEQVGGKLLVMNTTNGTAALLAAANAERVLVASLLNLSAVVAALAGAHEEVSVVCAGRERRFALEDAACAGTLALRLKSALGRRLELNDAGVVAMGLARPNADGLGALLKKTAAGRHLARIGHGDDVAYCAAVDRHDIVPELRDRQVTA